MNKKEDSQKSGQEWLFEALENVTDKPGSLKWLSGEVIASRINSYGYPEFLCSLRAEAFSSDFIDLSLPVEWVENRETKERYDWKVCYEDKRLSIYNSVIQCFLNNFSTGDIITDKSLFLPAATNSLQNIIPKNQKLRFQFYNIVSVAKKDGEGQFMLCF